MWSTRTSKITTSGIHKRSPIWVLTSSTWLNYGDHTRTWYDCKPWFNSSIPKIYKDSSRKNAYYIEKYILMDVHKTFVYFSKSSHWKYIFHFINPVVNAASRYYSYILLVLCMQNVIWNQGTSFTLINVDFTGF